MNESELQGLKQKLVSQQQEIQDLEATLKESSKTVTLDQSKVGRLSRMDALQGQQIALDASRRRQQKLIQIERALDRMKLGEYGYCLQCGEAIDIRRLHFDPSNVRCIECAESSDSGL